MANDGWIRLHRRVQDHWLWKDPVKFQWWVDILITVNHNPAKVNIGNELIECNRGQSIMSLLSWSLRWKVSKDTARNFLKLLEKDSMITLESYTKTTRLTVCKYDSYQTTLHDEQTLTKRSPYADQTLADPNNKNKEGIRRNKKDIVPPTVDEIRSYFKENGYSDDIAIRAFNYYDSAHWKDKSGKSVKNWKQKMIGVWFKEEHKIGFENKRTLVH